MCCVDKITIKRKKNVKHDELFHRMNSHHPNIRLIAKTNLTRFLKIAFGINPDGSQQQKCFKN